MLERATSSSDHLPPLQENDCSLPGLAFLGVLQGGPGVLYVSRQSSTRSVGLPLRKAEPEAAAPPQAQAMGLDGEKGGGRERASRR